MIKTSETMDENSNWLVLKTLHIYMETTYGAEISQLTSLVKLLSKGWVKLVEIYCLNQKYTVINV